MRRRYPTGFTIVEVVLFLAISGALAIALLVATTSAIQQQQYRDSVQSFAGFLRSQYERVVSVENDRQPGDDCPISGSISRAGRGQSDCVIVGRYVATAPDGAIDVDGSEYVAYPVYAREGSSGWEYGLGQADTTYSVSWSTKTKLPGQDSLKAYLAIIIYRHPENGNITVRSNPGRYSADTINHFINGRDNSGNAYDDPLTQLGQREICIYDDGWMLGRRQSVFIAARSGSADAIRVGGAEAEGCLNA